MKASFRVTGFHYEKGVNFSTLISKSHADTVWDYIKKGKEEGTRLITGEKPYSDAELAKGYFVPPTVFADVTPEMTIFQEEIFGPVLCVTPFETEEEAIAIANNNDYGLAGGVFTSNMKRGLRVESRLRAVRYMLTHILAKA